MASAVEAQEMLQKSMSSTEFVVNTEALERARRFLGQDLLPSSAVEIPEAMQTFLSKVTDCGSSYRGTDIYAAATEGHFPLGHLLLLAGKDVNGIQDPVKDKVSCRDASRRATALHWAAAHDKTSFITFLHHFGANINSRNGLSPNGAYCSGLDHPTEFAPVEAGWKQTPVMWAAHSGSFAALRTLVDTLHADLSLTDSRGFTVLAHALEHPDMFGYLASKTKVNVLDDSGRSLLHLAAQWNKYTAIRFLLDRYELDCSLTDGAGRTALDLAIDQANTKSVLYLLRAGSPLPGATPPPSSLAVSLLMLGCSGLPKALQRAVGYHGANQSPLAFRREEQLGHIGALVAAAREYDRTSETSPSADITTSRAACKGLSYAAQPWTAFKMNRRLYVRFLLGFFAPHGLLIGASLLPFYLGIFAVPLLVLLMTTGMTGSMKDGKMDTFTTGWFVGAYIFGMAVLWPTAIAGFASWLSLVPFFFFSACLLFFFFSCMFGDAGWVPHTKEDIVEFFKIAESGEIPDRKEWCIACLAKKPLRSKHCRISGHCVSRFDHYCVWLSNAVGHGNHWKFMSFAGTMTIAQLFTAYYMISWLIRIRYERGITGFGICATLSLLAEPQHRTALFIDIIYNTLGFMFIMAVVWTNVRLIGKNQTANESWFAGRYEYLFADRGNVYSMYDRGLKNNWLEILYPDKFCYYGVYELPNPSDSFIAAVRSYALREISMTREWDPNQFPPAVAQRIQADPSISAAIRAARNSDSYHIGSGPNRATPGGDAGGHGHSHGGGGHGHSHGGGGRRGGGGHGHSHGDPDATPMKGDLKSLPPDMLAFFNRLQTGGIISPATPATLPDRVVDPSDDPCASIDLELGGGSTAGPAPTVGLLPENADGTIDPAGLAAMLQGGSTSSRKSD